MNGDSRRVGVTGTGMAAAAVCLAVLAGLLVWGPSRAAAAPDDEAEAKRMEMLVKDVTQGALRVVKDGGEVVECPLKHTDVKAQVSGFIARVKVTQTFFNPLDENIEAVYVFPLPHKSAVDDMTMVYSSGRRIVGVIRRREEARAIYEQAIAQGATAALLEQERPNIFTQTVGNIKPKEQIEIEISYVDVLEYDRGTYEFHFPMVVGPRYIPGTATSDVPPVPAELKGKVGEIRKAPESEPGEAAPKDQPKGDGWAPDTDRVPDASRITPPVLKPGFRNGHDISLSITVDAGVPIRDLKVINHNVRPQQTGPSTAAVTLPESDSIPNKDFVLRYSVVGEKPEMALLTHTDPDGRGYFLLMIQPKEDARLREAPPREIVFLIDVSGSMSGQPTDLVRRTMAQMLKRCNPADTLQVVTFSGQANKLFDAPVQATDENIKTALNFTESIRGGGGTEMLKGVKMALDEPADPQRVRIVLMLTDGFIGNESEIIQEVGRRAGDRVRFWCLGIGTSVNRFLIDGVAGQGGGMGKVLSLTEDPTETVEEIMMRIHRAQLSNIAIDWGGVQVTETYPARIPELWAERPVVLFGRYNNGFGLTSIMVSGQVEGRPTQWPLQADFPASSPRHEVLAKVWARRKIEDLMQQTFYAGSPEVEQEVTQIALDYRLMSQYTSFVAVDQADLNRYSAPPSPPRRMLVPVPIPEGTRYEGFFGDDGGDMERRPVFLSEIDGLERADRNANGRWFSSPVRTGAPSPAMVPMTMKKKSSFNYGPGQEQGQLRAGGYFGPAVPRMSLTAPAKVTKEMPVRGIYARRQAISGDKSGSIGGFGARLQVDADDAEGLFAFGYSYDTYFPDQREAVAKLAAETLTKAEALAKDDAQLTAARQMCGYAYLLSAALGGNETAEKALEVIASIDERLMKSWTAAVPALDKKLDLVVRDKSVGQALAGIAAAAGLKITLTPGSEHDVAALLGRTDARVTWLDLRRATVAQAMDWTLQPLRLEWELRGDEVVVQSGRRGASASPWIYDVSLLTLPSKDELKGVDDQNKQIEAVRKGLAEFIKLTRARLGLGDDAMVWYGPSQMLVFADAAKHAEAMKLFADLADPEAKLEGDLTALHAVTSKRAGERKEAAAKSLTYAEMHRVAAALNEFSWRLMADAAVGKVDDEAQTELAIAWQSPQIAELLKDGRSASLCLRSLWALNESSQALPDNKALAALAAHGRNACRQAATDALSVEAAKLSQDYAYLMAAVYAGLAMRGDGETVVKASEVFGGMKGADTPVGNLSRIVLALLGPAEEIDAKALAEAATKDLPGEDFVVLAAMACRRAGGPAWTQFRAESQAILGDQALPGSVVVLVGHLSDPRLPLIAAK